MEPQKPLLDLLASNFNNSQELLLTFLLDGSGSISAESFEQLRKTTIHFIEKLEGVLTSVIQFSTNAEMVCLFTKDKQRLMDSVTSMQQQKGVTNMAQGFRLVRDQIAKTITPSFKPVIIFVTDGVPSDRPEEMIQKIMGIEPKPTVITIGICPASGQTNLANTLSRLLPKEPLFLIEDYAMLNDQIQQLRIKEPPAPLCRTTFTLVEVGMMREDIQVACKLEPETEQTIPAGTCVLFKENHFFYSSKVTLDKEVSQNGSIWFDVTLKIKPNAAIHGTFPDKQHYTIQYPQGYKYTSAIEIPVAWYCGEFLITDERQADEPVNILVWGKMGSGKSSLINDLIGIFLAQYEKLKVADVLNAPGHVTKTYMKFPVSEYIREKGQTEAEIANSLNLNIWDSWGLTDDNYPDKLIEAIVEGRMAENTEMATTITTAPADPARRIHAVILPIPIGAGQEPDLLKKLHEISKIFMKLQIRPIYVCTMCSQLDPDSIQANYDTIVKELGVQTDCVILHDNYTNEGRNIRQDLRIRAILERAYKEAKETKTRIAVSEKIVTPEKKVAFRRNSIVTPTKMARQSSYQSVNSPEESEIRPTTPMKPKPQAEEAGSPIYIRQSVEVRPPVQVTPVPPVRPVEVAPSVEVKLPPIPKVTIKTDSADEKFSLWNVDLDWTLARFRDEMVDQLDDELCFKYEFQMAHNGAIVGSQEEASIKVGQCTSNEAIPSINISKVKPPQEAIIKITFKTESGETSETLYIKESQVKSPKDLRAAMIEDEVLSGECSWVFLDNDKDPVRPKQEAIIPLNLIMKDGVVMLRFSPIKQENKA